MPASAPSTSSVAPGFKGRARSKSAGLAEVLPWWREGGCCPKRSASATPLITAADLELAREHYRRSLCSDGNGSLWPLWSTKMATLAEYGLGIELHFRFLTVAIRSFLIATLLMAPQVILSITGQALEARSAPSSVITLLAQTTIANLSTPSGGRDIFGQRFEAHSVTLVLAVLDALATAVLASGALWFKMVSLPRAMGYQRRMHLGPEAYTLEVHNLPKRLQSSRHAQYSSLLENHFAGLLDARVTENTVAPGLLVVHAADKGSVTWSHAKHRCCRRPCGFQGRSAGFAALGADSGGQDGRGRQLGRVKAIVGLTCEVEWLPVHDDEQPTFRMGKVAHYWIRDDDNKVLNHAAEEAGATGRVKFTTDSVEQTEISGALSDLLDAELLERLEIAGSDPAKRHKSELPVHSIQLVHDLWGFIRKKRQRERRPLVEENEHSPRSPPGQKKTRRLFTSPDDRLPFFSSIAGQNVLGAFVTFSRIQDRDFVRQEFVRKRLCSLQRFSPSWRLKFEGSKIWVDSAPAPADINWENCDSEPSICSIWFCFLILMCIVLVLGLCAVAATAQAAASSAEDADVQQACRRMGYKRLKIATAELADSCREWVVRTEEASRLAVFIAIIVSVANALVVSPVSYVVELACPKSRRLRDNVVFVAIFWVQMLNMCCVMPLVYFDFSGGKDVLGLFGKGSFTDLVPEWYDTVGGILLLILIFHSLHPLYGVVRMLLAHLWRHASSAQSIQELLEVYTPSRFDVAAREAELASILFSALMYSAAMPLLVPVLLVTMSLAYICDKYVLLRFSRAPHACCLMPTSMRRMVWSLLCGLWAHSAFATWAYSQAGAVPSRGHPRNGLERVLVDSALPHFITTIGLTAAIVAISLDLLLGSSRGFGSLDSVVTNISAQGYNMYDLPDLQGHMPGSSQSPSSSKGKMMAIKVGAAADASAEVGAKSSLRKDADASEGEVRVGPMIMDSHSEPSVIDELTPLENHLQANQWSKEDEVELDQLDKERHIEDTSEPELSRRACSGDMGMLCCNIGSLPPPQRPIHHTIPEETIGVAPDMRSRSSDDPETRTWLCSACTATPKEEVLYMGSQAGPTLSSLDIHIPAAARERGRVASRGDMVSEAPEPLHQV